MSETLAKTAAAAVQESSRPYHDVPVLCGHMLRQSPESKPPSSSGPNSYPHVPARQPHHFASTIVPPCQVSTKTTKQYRALAPAPPPPVTSAPPPQIVGFFDLPAELRNEIYGLVLNNIVIHILPLQLDPDRHESHKLVRVCRQIRNEVTPIIHSTCPIRVDVTDFDFSGLLAWMDRIPANAMTYLCKNQDLTISLCTSSKPVAVHNSMRRWLHDRADPHRLQPNWRYAGPSPKKQVANDLKRRVKRMTEPGKRAELVAMLEALKVEVPRLREANEDVGR